MNPNLFLLILSQGLFVTSQVASWTVTNLLGHQLSPSPYLATLPVTAIVIGGALSTSAVAKLHRLYGRRAAFQIGILAGASSLLLFTWAAFQASFIGLVLAGLILGYYLANASLYRFASGEVVAAPMLEKAMSWVLLGGLLGSFLGARIARYTEHSVSIQYAGAYIALLAVSAVSLLIISLIRFDSIQTHQGRSAGRSAAELIKQPKFLIAILAGTLSYALMSLLMNATPLAVKFCGFGFGTTTEVIQWHIIGMFAPGLITGSLLKRFGDLKIMAGGAGLFFLSIAIALTGQTQNHFIAALIFLGVAWNLVYTAASALLTKTYLAEEKTTAQSAMDRWVFIGMTISTLLSGALISSLGWMKLNGWTLVPLILSTLCITYLLLKDKRSKT